jgi:hypothetical protein
LRINPDALNRSERTRTLEERMQELVKEMDNIRDNWMPDDEAERMSCRCRGVCTCITMVTERSREFHPISVVRTFRKVSKTSSTSLLKQTRLHNHHLSPACNSVHFRKPL